MNDFTQKHLIQPKHFTQPYANQSHLVCEEIVKKIFVMTGDSFQHIYKAYNMQYVYIVDSLAPSYRDVFSNFQMGPLALFCAWP